MPSTMSRRTSLAAGLLCVVVVAGFSVALSEQPLPNRQPPLSLNALASIRVPRNPDLHPTGYRAITRGNLLRIGGVLSQTARLVAPNGADVPVSISLASTSDYPGYIVVRLSDSARPYRYPITYADLVAMTLFVDSGGTSLYTLWDRGDDRLSTNFLPDAGFTEHRIEGLLALEFAGTRYADALYFLDTCQGCVESPDPALDAAVERINTAISGERYTDLQNDARLLGNTYINVDVELPFRVRPEAERLIVDGGVARLTPTVSGDHIVITEAQRLVTPDRLLHAVKETVSRTESDFLRVLLEVAADDDLDEEQIESTLESMSAAVSLSRRKLLQEALLQDRIVDVRFLFESLALLRSARESRLRDWQRFRQELASEPLVRNDPQPWNRYVESLCDVYEDHDQCRQPPVR